MSDASLRPANIQRLDGGKKFRYVVRSWPAGVMHALPRSTIWPLMNFPLYSPTAPAAGAKRGYGRYALGGPLPHVAERLAQPRTGRRGGRVQPGAVRRAMSEATGSGIGPIAERDRVLPLEFGRQPGAGPARERVGLVVAHVNDRLTGVDGAAAVEREARPAVVVVVTPVRRCVPPVVLHRVPTVRQPQLRLAVSTVGDELHPFACRHEAVGDPERFEVHLVAGRLVVECEAGVRVSGLDEPAVEVDESHRLDVWRDRERCLDVGRLERVAREHVLDVHQQQLLMLLLMVHAELDECGNVGPVRVGTVDELAHCGIDVRPVAADLLDVRSRDQTALIAGMSRSDGLVVRVEQVAELEIEGVVAGEARLEQEGLEEPGGVPAVPLGRAHVGHRLDDLVFRAERRGERFGEVADVAEARAQLRPLFVARRTIVVRHAPSDPKQAATQASLRAGACHSTTEIIVFPLVSSEDVRRTCCPGLPVQNIAVVRAPDLGDFRAGVNPTR